MSGMIHPVRVASTQYLAPQLKLVRLVGDLQRTTFEPGQVIEFRINERDFRHYTPMRYDVRKGICELLFYLHRKGPGSAWAEALQPGDEVRLMGPGGRLKFKPGTGFHFFFGDETGLALFSQLQSVVHARDEEYLCLMELDDPHFSWPGLVDLEAEKVKKSQDAPAQEAIEWLDDLPPFLWNTWQDAHFYLCGRAASIKNFRQGLLRRGVSGKQISSQPYWADQKRGL